MDTYDIMLYVSYLLIAIGLVLAIMMPLIKSMDNPKSLLKTVIGIVGIGVLFFIAYSISDNSVSPRFQADPFNLTPAGAQAVGGMLITTYILFLLAILGIIYTETIKIVK